MDHDDVGILLAIAAGTLVVFYVIWAAMHDIAHGAVDPTFEYAALALSVLAFAFLYRKALLILTPKFKVGWLTGVGLLMILFDVGALSANLRPKYPKDPILGALFLTASLPVLGLIIYHLLGEARHQRNPKS
jgi:hypothetical protein